MDEISEAELVKLSTGCFEPTSYQTMQMAREIRRLRVELGAARKQLKAWRELTRVEAEHTE